MARIRELFFAALAAVEPARAVRNWLEWHDGCLVVGDKTLPAPKGVHVVAVGKAAVAMTQGALAGIEWEHRLGGRYHQAGPRQGAAPAAVAGLRSRSPHSR